MPFGQSHRAYRDELHTYSVEVSVENARLRVAIDTTRMPLVRDCVTGDLHAVEVSQHVASLLELAGELVTEALAEALACAAKRRHVAIVPATARRA